MQPYVLVFDISTYGHYLFSPVKPSVWICQRLYIPLKASEHFKLKYWWERHSLQSNRALWDRIWSLRTKMKKKKINAKAEEYLHRKMFWPHWLWMTLVVSLLGCFQDTLSPWKPMFNSLKDWKRKKLPASVVWMLIQYLSEVYPVCSQWWCIVGS